MSAVKISALHLFNRIFPDKTFHSISNLITGMITGYGISFTIVSRASCKIFASDWNKEIKNGTCIDMSKFYTAQTVLGVIFDVIVVALPMPMPMLGAFR